MATCSKPPFLAETRFNLGDVRAWDCLNYPVSLVFEVSCCFMGDRIPISHVRKSRNRAAYGNLDHDGFEGCGLCLQISQLASERDA